MTARRWSIRSRWMPWRWRAYQTWHLVKHVWLGRYRFLCHFCGEDDARLGRRPKVS